MRSDEANVEQSSYGNGIIEGCHKVMVALYLTILMDTVPVKKSLEIGSNYYFLTIKEKLL